MQLSTPLRPRRRLFPGNRHLLAGKHIVMTMVAVFTLVTALLDGGYSPEFRAGAALVLWWAVIIALGLGGWPRAVIPRGALACGCCLAGLATLTLTSMLWAGDAGRVFTEFVRVSTYLGLFTLVVLATPVGSARRWLAGLTLGLLAVSAVALASRLQPELFPANQLASFLPNTRARLSYPLEYWNGMAAVLALSFVALVGFGAAARTAARRAMSVGAVPIPAFALFLTSSRGGVAAAALGVAVLVALGPARGRLLIGTALGTGGGLMLAALAARGDALIDGQTASMAARVQGDELLLAASAVVSAVGGLRYALDTTVRSHRLTRRLRTAAVAAAALALLAAVVASNPVARFNELTAPPAGAASPNRGFVASHIASAQGTGRAQFWESALDAFASSPVHGVGSGGYEAWWAEHGSLAYYVRDAHSLFLEQLAELGPIGFALIAGFFVAAFAAGRTRRAGPKTGPVASICLALLACGGASAALDWSWELPAAFGPVVVVAALLTGPATLAQPAVPARGRYPWGVATLVAGWIVVLAAAVALIGQIKLSDSRDAVRRGDLATAGNDAATAAGVQPWSATLRLQEALVAERRGDIRGALAANRAALDRAGGDWRLWLTEARLRAKAGDVVQARRALARARELNPRSPIFAGAR